MGEVRVPADALWRAQTQRAVENFPISGTPLEPRLVHALGLVKAAAAQANVTRLAAEEQQLTQDLSAEQARWADINDSRQGPRTQSVTEHVDRVVYEACPHHAEAVMYVVEGGKVRSHNADGETTEIEIATGATVYREPVTHWTENIGTTTIRIILVELKNQPGKPQ